jgi:tRNA-dihydrouridine synthase
MVKFVAAKVVINSFYWVTIEVDSLKIVQKATNMEIIYQAPLQGFTDFTYRKTLQSVYGGVTKYFIPYLSYGKGKEIKKSQLKEILPANNTGIQAIPQVLFSDQVELSSLVMLLLDHGYREINLNLGCPYPMATNRGRGAAWLDKPQELNELLALLFENVPDVKFSIKMRAGMNDTQHIGSVLEVLNMYPLHEVIYHPRTASQMYTGKADPALFVQALSLVKHPMVYNGDINSVEDLQALKALMPNQLTWMTGRGLLTDPALAIKLNGAVLDELSAKKKLREFHDRLLEEYASRLQGSGHLLAKMGQFWVYFSEAFDNPHKTLKLIKKAGSLIKYNAAVAEIFRS